MKRTIPGILAALAILVAASLPAAADTAKPLRLLAFGDSLTAGYGLATSDAFPAKLEKALKARGARVEVVNAGVSGDTASGGLARLDWALGEPVDAVIVELGANDMLRGVDPAVTRKALDDLLGRLAGRKLPVLLAGIYAAPNLGPDYGQAFNAIFPDLARKYGLPLYPFFLDGVTGNAALQLADGMHPNAAGVDIVVARILPEVEKLLARAG